MLTPEEVSSCNIADLHKTGRYKMIRYNRSIVFIGATISLLWGSYTLEYSLSDFSFYEDNGYDRIEAEGFVSIGEPGTPQLPSIHLHYIIPQNAKVESLVILQSVTSQIPGEFLVFPNQPPVMSGQTVPWFPPDTSIYNSDEPYPEKLIQLVDEGVMDGARIATVAVHPIVYRPQSKRLFMISRVEFDFAFGPEDPPEVQPQVRGEYEQTVYDAALKSVVVNDYEIPLYYRKPTLVNEDQLGQGIPFPTAPVMIITDPIFFDAFQPYADWLTEQGLYAKLISPQTIYANFVGVDEADEIRKYISYCYRYAGGTYFILGGMDDRVGGPASPELPVRVCYCYEASIHQTPPDPHIDTVACDYYFCQLDGNWNADGDDLWGEIEDEVDQFPEVYVGRILCRDVEEADYWVNKALNYEKSPENIESLTTAVWIWQKADHGGWKMADINCYPDWFGHVIAENCPAYDAFTLLDRGYGFTNAQAHGTIDYFRTGYISAIHHTINSYLPYAPSPSSHGAGLNWLANENKNYIHYSVACKTGWFDSGYDHLCIAEAFTTALPTQEFDDPVGACASIEHTRVSLESEPMSSPGTHSVKLQDEYNQLIFTPEEPLSASFSRIGVAEALAKTNMPWAGSNPPWYYEPFRYVCYSTNLFGSPSTPAWTNTPGNINVSHPNHIPAHQQTDFNVIVTDALNGNPVKHAKVCLHKPSDIYYVGITDMNGCATFLITPNTVGIIKVTVTRYHNYEEFFNQYLPSQTTCEVTRGGGTQASDSAAILPNHLCITQTPTLVSNRIVLKYGVPKEGKIHCAIYNCAGSRVKVIKEAIVQPDYYEDHAELKDLPNGIYFIVLRQRNDKISKKIILVR